MSLNEFIITNLAANGLEAGFEGESEFLGTVGTRLSKEFMQPSLDVGQTINEVLPPRPNPWIDGRVINPQASVYEEVPITVIQSNTSRLITDAELVLDRKSFFEDIVKPDVNGGVRNAERAALLSIMTSYPSMVNIDYVGQDPTNSQIWSNTRAKYQMMLGPKNVFGIMNPLTMGLLAENEAKLFRPSETVDVAALKGRVKELAGVGNLYDSVNLPTFLTSNTDRVGAVNGAAQTGTSLITDGWSSGTTFFKGEQFYFSTAGVGNALDPEIHTENPFKQVFTLSQDCAISGGAATLVFGPSIIISGSLQDQLIAPPDNTVITFIGDANTTYQQHFLYAGGDSGAINFVGLKLPTFSGRGGESKVKSYKNVPLRSVYFTDYKDGQNYLRYDKMCGAQTRYWQWVWRFWGSKVG